MRIKLGDDERVIVKTRQHRRVLVRPVILLFLVVGASGFGLGWLGREDVAAWAADLTPLLTAAVFVIGGLLMLGWSVRPYLRWARTWYYLTNRRVVIRTGVSARSLRELPLVLIRELVVRQSVAQRSVQAGHLMLLTANGETTLKNVPSVHKLRELTLDAIEDLPRSVMFDGADFGAEQAIRWSAPAQQGPLHV
ncbi:PH domain-containing protein [Zhihengliuella flava]|uniref:Membrane protein YdbT with pleckstrin-like domain n=1 Tax=Zhihengliuella flava TaxID=1285193 RepID=A0A931GI52_9MICC|nr:PH domain-containing protein [Zhihengliuella flava]MBG6083916.1 putative membrane protein YdbT with pleckstrin-like domain [Zhihengliuella flava]